MNTPQPAIAAILREIQELFDAIHAAPWSFVTKGPLLAAKIEAFGSAGGSVFALRLFRGRYSKLSLMLAKPQPKRPTL